MRSSQLQSHCQACQGLAPASEPSLPLLQSSWLAGDVALNLELLPLPCARTGSFTDQTGLPATRSPATSEYKTCLCQVSGPSTAPIPDTQVARSAPKDLVEHTLEVVRSCRLLQLPFKKQYGEPSQHHTHVRTATLRPFASKVFQTSADCS